MIENTMQTKNKRGRPPLSDAKKQQRSKASENARLIQKSLRSKIALLKSDFRTRLKIASQEGYQKALEKIVKIERRKMDAHYKALAAVKAKVAKKVSKASQRMLMSKARIAKPVSSLNLSMAKKVSATARRRGRPRKAMK
jgi:hypothetical protein